MQRNDDEKENSRLENLKGLDALEKCSRLVTACDILISFPLFPLKWHHFMAPVFILLRLVFLQMEVVAKIDGVWTSFFYIVR